MKQRLEAFVLSLFFSVLTVSHIQAGTLKSCVDSQ